jgi:hypothetical protein
MMFLVRYREYVAEAEVAAVAELTYSLIWNSLSSRISSPLQMLLGPLAGQ